jgi:hypothetical protein|tara:strand:+ start:4638 stop:4796 length:159 start_codon:yes stop_codon:yes gene_type:complete
VLEVVVAAIFETGAKQGAMKCAITRKEMALVFQSWHSTSANFAQLKSYQKHW